MHLFQHAGLIKKNYTIFTVGAIKKMDNPEKLATYGTHDEEKQSKNTTQYVLDTIMGKQTHITYI